MKINNILNQIPQAFKILPNIRVNYGTKPNKEAENIKVYMAQKELETTVDVIV